MDKERVSAYFSFKKFLLKFDVLADPFKFYLPDGRAEYRTTTGGCVFLVLIVMYLTLVVLKLTAFVRRD